MSLINEALRKARQAASEHDAKQPGGAFQPAKAYPSRRSGRGGGPLAVALVAVTAAVIGAAGAWWFVSHVPPETTEPAVAEVRSIDAAAAVATPAASPTAAEEQLESPSGAPAVQAPAPGPIRPEDVIEAVPTVSRSITSEPAPARVAANEPVGPNGERIFVLEAKLGYASLSLGYIVARTDNPFAEINGTEVYVGSEIEGFTVEAIEANRVVLQDDKGPLVLQVPY